MVGWIRGWALGWLVLVARQLWLGRLPIDGLAWWVVVGRQAGKLSGLLFGPTNHPIPRQQTAQPLFSTANLSSAGASVLAQAHPDMNLPSVASWHPPPSPMFSTLPFPLADITRAARPREQRHYTDARPLPPHNASRAWGCASRPSSLLLVPRARWLPVACLSLAKPVGQPLATHKPKPRPWTCSEGQRKARVGVGGVGGVGLGKRRGP